MNVSLFIHYWCS